MAQSCKACLHPDSRQLDADLIAGIRTVGEIAVAYRLSDAGVRRHRANHLSATVLQSPRAGENAGPSDLLQKLVQIMNDSESVRQAALVANRPDQVLRAGRETRVVVELLLDRLGITDVTVVEELEMGAAFRFASGLLIRRAPKWGHALAAVLEEEDHRSLAYDIRAFAETAQLALDKKAETTS